MAQTCRIGSFGPEGDIWNGLGRGLLEVSLA